MRKQLERIISILLVILFIICSVPFFCIVSSAEPFPELDRFNEDSQKIEYKLDKSAETATILGLANDFPETITVPDKVVSNDFIYKVVGIENYAFENKKGLKSVIIPNSVKTIGLGAFAGNKNLESVILPEGLEIIDEIVFSDCISLKAVKIPDSVTSIENDAFYGCTNLTEVLLPAKLQKIDKYAFGDCKNLISVKFPENVKNINAMAFSQCLKLQNIELPENLNYIGTGAFKGCNVLQKVRIPKNVSKIELIAFEFCYSIASFTVDPANAFYSDKDGVLFNKDKTTLIQYPVGNTATQYTIPKSVKTIEKCAFEACWHLECFKVEDSTYFSVDESGVLFDKDKTFLIQYPIRNEKTNYTIPEGVKKIGTSVFGFAENLSDIIIPDSVESIGTNAFYGTKWLKDNKDEYIYTGKVFYQYNGDKGGAAFYTVRDGTKGIANYAFSNCENMTDLDIPASVVSIGDQAFTYCKNLKKINIKGNSTAFSSDETGVLFNNDKTVLVQYPINNSNSSYVIPKSVNKIGDFAFFSATKLLNITIPSSVTSIGESAFENSGLMNDIDLPINLTEIGDYAFYDCQLSAVTIPEGVTVLKEYTFNDITITIPDTVKTIVDDALTAKTILGRKNSAAEEYAKKNNIEFVEYVDRLIENINKLDYDNLTSLSATNVRSYKEIYDKLPEASKKEITNADKLIKCCEKIDLMRDFPLLSKSFLNDTVKITAPVGVVSKDIIAEASESSPTSEQKKETEYQFGNKTAFVKCSYITVKKTDGTAAEQNKQYGNVSASIKIDDNYKNDSLTVIYIDNSGKIAELTADTKDGFITFQAADQGFYAVIKKDGLTGINILLIIIGSSVLLLAAAAVIIIIVVKKRRKKKSLFTDQPENIENTFNNPYGII